MAAENIMSVSYGIDVLPDHDPYIALAQKVMKVAGEVAMPGTFLVVRYIPLLVYSSIFIHIVTRTPSRY